jgi:hypothetical protein
MYQLHLTDAQISDELDLMEAQCDAIDDRLRAMGIDPDELDEMCEVEKLKIPSTRF